MIGLSPQELNFDVFFTIEELLTLQAGYFNKDKKEAKRRALEMLEYFNLTDKRKSKARELSGGMKRRVQIAKAFIHDPPLIILDEPTAGVDIELRYQLWDFLKEQNKNGGFSESYQFYPYAQISKKGKPDSMKIYILLEGFIGVFGDEL